MIREFTDLKVWQVAHKLVLDIYIVTRNFPKEELFGLTSQMRRSAISSTSNISEGFGRFTYKEKIRFYYIASGSLSELKNQVIISKDINLIKNKEYISLMDQLDEAHRLLKGLIKSSKNLSG